MRGDHISKKYSTQLYLWPSLDSCPEIPLFLPPLKRDRSPGGLTHSLPKKQSGW